MKNRDYHEDKKLRIVSERHAGIVIRRSKVLLIHRIKDGYEYWVIPGGHRRHKEKPEEAVIREVEEETSVITKNPRLAFKSYDKKREQEDFYYLCQFVSGEELVLKGEEGIRNEKDNFYEPKWICLKEVKSLNVLPKIAKDWLVENLC